MKILQIIREEIVPLSSRKQLILLIIIACIFQFVLFYTPALADEAVSQAQAKANAQDMLIVNDSIAKSGIIVSPETDAQAGVSTLLTASSSPEIATSTPGLASSTPELATSTPAKATSTPTVKVLETSKHTITAYNSDVSQTDDDPCTTANGFNVCKHNQEDTIAANFLKFGTKVKIPALFGDHVFIVRDRMNSKHPNRVDVWMKNYSDAINFGVKVADIQVVN
jgi:3D (Asp-Asp-Asp) domain-containing protein